MTIEYADLSPAQAKWVDLVEILFPELYNDGIISHTELKVVHEHFVSLRATDKKYKVSWPIWLIMNNSVARGVYAIPKRDSVVGDDKDEYSDHPFYPKLESELKQFGIIA